MTEVVIYSTKVCPFCTRAKQLLDSKGVAYNEILVDEDLDKREEMLRLSGGQRSVPQIFIGTKHIGGFDDLKSLNDQSKLDSLLLIN